jgi:hypothetical protein
MSPMRYDLGFYIAEDDILHSHRRENLKSYNVSSLYCLFDDDGARGNVEVGALCYKPEGLGIDSQRGR